jgi:hypothetical protein
LAIFLWRQQTGNHGQSAESDPSPLIERYKKLVDPDSEVHAKKCSQRKQRKEKNECYRDQKGKRGNVRNHCRALSRGHVATKHGVVTLTGLVSSFWEKDAAEKDAILVHAVKGVANDIEVRPFWQPTDPDIARHAIRDPVFDRRMLSGFSGWSGASRSAIAGTFARQACVKLDGKKRYGRANRNWNSAIS